MTPNIDIIVRETNDNGETVETCIAECNVVEGFRCEECEEVFEETAGVPLYECNECGTIYSKNESADGNSHRCPDCSKFGSKIADDCCALCEEGAVEEIVAAQCPGCQEWYDVSKYADHVRQCLFE